MIMQPSQARKINLLFVALSNSQLATSQLPKVPKRENKELRFTVVVWVEKTFDEAIASHFSGLSPRCSLSKTLLEVLKMWHKCFKTIEGVTKGGVLHRDISFQNFRVDENYEPTICDFDMAVNTNGKATEAMQRTGTLQFMARGILQDQSHHSFHDCKSVYWLCAMALNSVLASPAIQQYVKRVTDFAAGHDNILVAKLVIIWDLHTVTLLQGQPRDREEYLMGIVHPKNAMERGLINCLLDLSTHFADRGF